LEQLDTP